MKYTISSITLFLSVLLLACATIVGCKKESNTSNPVSTTYTITTTGALMAASRLEFECDARSGSAVSWKFGDGTSFDTIWAPGAYCFHYYTAAGTYTVKLIVNNDSAHAITKVLVITANYNYYLKGVAIKGDTIFCKFQAPLPAGNTYLWNFGDGTTSTDATPYHIYTATGTYNTSLIVNSDSSKYDYKPITIYNDPIYTHLLSASRSWHGQIDRIALDGSDSVLLSADTTYAMTVIDPLTVSFFGDNMSYDPLQSTANVLFFSANVPSSNTSEWIYFDHVKDSVSYYFKRDGEVKYPQPGYSLETRYHTH